MLNNYCWFKLTNRSKVVEGVILEDLVNECTTRRQELIGTCTIWVFFFFSNQNSFCLSYDNGQSEQRKISQGANRNSTWNEVKLSVGKCQSSSPDYFKFWTWLDQSSRWRENFLDQSPIKYQYNIKQTSDENEEKLSIRGLLVDTKFFSLKNCPS